jgi:hypothetical protein
MMDDKRRHTMYHWPDMSRTLTAQARTSSDRLTTISSLLRRSRRATSQLQITAISLHRHHHSPTCRWLEQVLGGV